MARPTPKATLREIEKALDERLGRMRARMVQDVALASPQADWKQADPQERPTCPECGTSLQARGKKKRQVQTQGGQEVVLNRSYGMCPTCGVGFFPLDEQLDLVAGGLSPCSQEHLVHLAVWMPFERATQMLSELTGVQVSEATARRFSYRAGKAIQAIHRAQVCCPAPQADGETCHRKQIISVDGAMVSLLKGQWAEVKTVVVGHVEAAQPGEGVRSTHLSSFSRMQDAPTFTEQASAEMLRRGVDQAKQVCAVMDGAEWIDGFVDWQRADALRILDFAHAAEYVSGIGQLAQAAGARLPEDWLPKQLHELKHGGPAAVLEELRHLRDRHPHVEDISKKLAYLEKREARMQYPEYQAQGWPIGSGIVESGNKVVMQARLKGPGMHWAAEHVNPMLALRTSACNDRWAETYEQVQVHLHRQKRGQRTHRHQQR